MRIWRRFHFARRSRGRMSFPQMTDSIAVGTLCYWMFLLTVKHVVGDFLLQNRWMALGKDAKTGWAAPLFAHVAVHGALITALLLLLAPRLWFLAPVDFCIHLMVDRAKGICVANFRLTNVDHWYWWLIGIDQAIHHLTDFALAIILSTN
jgi:Protein of unknown function (DUF3307)